MADKEAPKTVLAHCKNCASQIEVEVPEYMKKVEKLPCQCGMTADIRQTRMIITGLAFVLVTLFLAMFGGCAVEEYFKAERVRAVKGMGYEVYDGADPYSRSIPPKLVPPKGEEKKP